MRKELFETGKTVDAAIDSACEKLGCSRESCEWEIIDLPKKGFLGLKNTPAKVRVSVDVPDEKPVRRQKPQERTQPTAPTAQSTADIKAAAPRQQQKQIETPEQPSEYIKTEELTEKEELAKEYLSQIIAAAGFKAEYVVTRERGCCCINIVGDGLGTIIGRRGETLDAIQYLVGLAANRGEGEYLRLTVDCGNYRLKRKETLEMLAKRLAHQVLKTNVSKILEPMNPFERRIIHATVSGIEGVSSSSVGEEPMRRGIITSPTARPAPRGGVREQRREGGYAPGRATRHSEDERPARAPREGGEDGDDRGRRGRVERRGGGGGRFPSRRPATPATSGPPKQTPEAEATTGISFGPIDLE